MKSTDVRCAAVVLAAGAGKRMKSHTKKQFLHLREKPIIYYSLQAFEESFIDEVVLVVSQEDVEYCQKEIVEKYRFSKVKQVIVGGKERYHSVAAGIEKLTPCEYVFIHDGARPMVTQDILERAYACVQEHNACVVGMPVKDTVKMIDKEGFISHTPDRSLMWIVQTPQVFSYELIRKAYEELLRKEEQLKAAGVNITDDAMVVETLMNRPVKIVEGAYENIKITTPEDLKTAENFL